MPKLLIATKLFSYFFFWLKKKKVTMEDKHKQSPTETLLTLLTSHCEKYRLCRFINSCEHVCVNTQRQNSVKKLEDNIFNVPLQTMLVRS